MTAFFGHAVLSEQAILTYENMYQYTITDHILWPQNAIEKKATTLKSVSCLLHVYFENPLYFRHLYV